MNGAFNRRKFTTENLDVPETSHDQEIECGQDLAAKPQHAAVLSVVGPASRSASARRARYRPFGTKCLTIDQAINIKEAVDYAREIGRPLIAHVTIHWSGTVAFDDHKGTRFARVCEGLNKFLIRRGVDGGLTAVWCRECKAQTDVVHCHLLFHLPVEDRRGARLLQIEAAVSRLVDRHGDGILGEFAVRLTVHPDPDGLYLLKGGSSDVWERFRIRKEWRQSQGIIHGKRCGTTQNIGPAARQQSALKRETASC